MESKKLIISDSLLSQPLERIGPNFFLNMLRLKSIGYTLFCNLNDLPSLSKTLLDDNIFIQLKDNLDTQSTPTISYDAKGDLFIFTSINGNISDSSLENLVDKIILPTRSHKLKRNTSETKISIDLNLDGSGKSEISTGLHFFNHMLDQIVKHSKIDLKLTCDGDLEVDEHHTIEDTAIALGEAILKALGDKKGVNRYSFIMPMDESKCEMTLDLSGRPFLEYQVSLQREYVGDFPTEMTKHFFYSLAIAMRATLHIKAIGDNDHHIIESMFKAFALVLKQAITRDERYLGIIPSSKGVL